MGTCPCEHRSHSRGRSVGISSTTVVAHASRIGGSGDAGDVIVSDSVRQLAAGKGFTFEPRREVSLKGFADPERVWKVTDTGSA